MSNRKLYRVLDDVFRLQNQIANLNPIRKGFLIAIRSQFMSGLGRIGIKSLTARNTLRL